MHKSFLFSALPLSALFVASCVGPSAEAAAIVKGKIYASETAMDAPLFFYENTRSEEAGKALSKTRYSDLEGKALVDEEVDYEAGKLKHYRYTQHQTNEHGTIDIEAGKVKYTYVEEEGRETGEDKWDEAMLLPDMLEARINEHWATIAAGDEMKFRFLILEKQDNFGFKVFKSGELSYQGKPATELTMKASGFFVALAAPAFKIIVEKDAPHRFLKMVGRLPIRIPKRIPPQGRKDLKAMDGVLVLDHEASASPAAGAGASSAGGSSPAGSAGATGAAGVAPAPAPVPAPVGKP